MAGQENSPASEQDWLKVKSRQSMKVPPSPLSALVDVVLAVGSLEARRALTGVAVDVVGARAPIPARLTQTLVGVCLTFVSMKPRQAHA